LVRIAAGAAIVWCCGVGSGAADEPSMPAPHPDFQAMHVMFGRWTCTFHLFNGKIVPVAGVTELSSDGRRAVSHDPNGVYFSNVWYDAVRKLWIETAIYTFDGMDFTATSRGWGGGAVVFNGLVTLRGQSLPLRTTTTLVSGGRNRTLEEIQDPDGNWRTLDSRVCESA
jgi:hypothetical protein